MSNIISIGPPNSSGEANPVLNIDSSENRIGIHTTSPLTTLDISNSGALILPRGSTLTETNSDIAGCIRFNLTTQLLEGYSDEWNPLYVQCNDDMTNRVSLNDNTLAFFTTDVERFKIDASGNFGINTDICDNYLLDVSGTIYCDELYINGTSIMTQIHYIYSTLRIGYINDTNDSPIGDISYTLDLDSNLDICGNAVIESNMLIKNETNKISAVDASGSIQCTRIEVSDICYTDVIIPNSIGDLTYSKVGDIRINSLIDALEFYNGTAWSELETSATKTQFMTFNHVEGSSGFGTTDSSIELTRLSNPVTNSFSIITNSTDIYEYTKNDGGGIAIDTSGIFLATVTFVAEAPVAPAADQSVFRFMIFKDTTTNSSEELAPTTDTSTEQTNAGFIDDHVDSNSNIDYIDTDYASSTHNWKWMTNCYVVPSAPWFSSDTIVQHNSFQFTLSEPSSLIVYGNTYSGGFKHFQLNITKLGDIGTISESISYGDAIRLNISATGNYIYSEIDGYMIFMWISGIGTLEINDYDVSAEFLIVGGGGSGGYDSDDAQHNGFSDSGGGGGGGSVEDLSGDNLIRLITGESYSITVGDGGEIGDPSTNYIFVSNGGNSILMNDNDSDISYTAYGGGYGAGIYWNDSDISFSWDASYGGSGGGGGGWGNFVDGSGIDFSNALVDVSGEGSYIYSGGGSYWIGSYDFQRGGGGGGAGGLPPDYYSYGSQQGIGGNGKLTTIPNISDDAYYYSSGGWGTNANSASWTGNRFNTYNATTGAGSGNGGNVRENGSNGIVICRIPRWIHTNLFSYSNVIITYGDDEAALDGTTTASYSNYFDTNAYTSNGTEYYSVKFYRSVTMTIGSVYNDLSMNVLLVGGGGAGGWGIDIEHDATASTYPGTDYYAFGGGGGAGEMVEVSGGTISPDTYTITIGGAGAASGVWTGDRSGTESSITNSTSDTIQALGGGGGGGRQEETEITLPFGGVTYSAWIKDKVGETGGSGGGTAGTSVSNWFNSCYTSHSSDYGFDTNTPATNGTNDLFSTTPDRYANAGGNCSGGANSIPFSPASYREDTAAGGGGGGAGGNGDDANQDSVYSKGGDGGEARMNNYWDDSDISYAGGGGAGGYYSVTSGGGSIGGYGQIWSTTGVGSGTTYTGSGGGGGLTTAGNGGSGIIILRFKVYSSSSL